MLLCSSVILGNKPPRYYLRYTNPLWILKVQWLAGYWDSCACFPTRPVAKSSCLNFVSINCINSQNIHGVAEGSSKTHALSMIDWVTARTKESVPGETGDPRYYLHYQTGWVVHRGFTFPEASHLWHCFILSSCMFQTTCFKAVYSL